MESFTFFTHVVRINVSQFYLVVVTDSRLTAENVVRRKTIEILAGKYVAIEST
jgi:hypothetical protein